MSGPDRLLSLLESARAEFRAGALRDLPNLAVSAMFSALTPGTHLFAHSGPTNAVISLSMGLVAPLGCAM